ncbi:MAG: zf-HC2 domain-containing protein [Myxococcales bacterium]|nr:zf-HC2 domain-containing protein [Myxococcales bacterium]
MALDDLVAGVRCRDVLAQLGDYVDGGLAPAARLALEAHVAGCNNCAAFGGAYGALVARLRAPAPAPALASDVADRLARRLTSIDDP